MILVILALPPLPQCLTGRRGPDWTSGPPWAPWTERHQLKVSSYFSQSFGDTHAHQNLLLMGHSSSFTYICWALQGICFSGCITMELRCCVYVLHNYAQTSTRLRCNANMSTTVQSMDSVHRVWITVQKSEDSTDKPRIGGLVSGTVPLNMGRLLLHGIYTLCLLQRDMTINI